MIFYVDADCHYKTYNTYNLSYFQYHRTNPNLT